MATYEEITLDQGADASIKLELINPDGSKKSLANYTIAGKIKKDYSDSSGEATAWTTTIGSPSTNGVCTLSLTNTQTGNLKSGRYVYDVEASYQDSDDITIVERILEGIVTITPSVTK